MSLQAVYYDLPLTGSVKYSAQAQDFCDPELLDQKRDNQRTPYEPIITLELNSWALDGSRTSLKAYAPPPFWGRATSDGAGEMLDPAMVEVTMSQRCTASGVTLIFWEETNQWCSRIKLSWYRGEELLAQERYYPQSPRFVVQKHVEDFDRLVLSMESTNLPQRFPRLSYLLVGQELTFQKDSLVSVKSLTEYDPTGCTLSADTVTVEVRSESEIRAQENQLLELYRSGELFAACRITGSRRTGINSFVLSAQSIIGTLEEQVIVNLYNHDTAYEVMSQIMGQTPWEMDESFRDQPISGYIPVCKCREALQQLAFVLGARVSAADGTVRLLPREQEVTGAFLPGEIFSDAQLETDSKLVKLEVTAHSYTRDPGERLLLDDQYVDGEDVRFMLDTPCYEYRIEGGEITDSGTNTVVVTAHGNIRLYGKPYVHTGVLHSRREAGSGSVLTVDQATLVNSENVHQVMDGLMETASLRQRLKQNVVLGSHYAGQRVTSPTPWGSTLEGVITAVEAYLTPHGQTANITIQGEEVNA